MVVQNITIPTNITNLAQLGTFVNTATSGLFGVGILFALFIIITIGLAFRMDPVKAALAASVVDSFICFFLIALGFVSSFYLVVFIGLDMLFGLLALLRGAADPY